jgi:hypothetical protein
MPSLSAFRAFYPKYNSLSNDEIIKASEGTSTPVWYDEPDEKPEEETSDFTLGLKNSFEQLKPTVYGLGAAVAAGGEAAFGEGGNFTEAKNYLVDKYKDANASIQQPSTNFDQAWDEVSNSGDPSKLIDLAQYGAGQAVGQGVQLLATSMLGGKLGMLAAEKAAPWVIEKIVADNVAKGLTVEAATKIAGETIAKAGSTAAIAGSSAAMEGSEIGGGLAQKSAEENRALTPGELGQGAAATIGATALDFAGDKLGLDALTGKFGSKLANPLMRGAATGLMAAPMEAATEGAQTLTEEYGKGNDALSPESLSQARTAAFMGVLVAALWVELAGLLINPNQPNQSTAQWKNF